jgi:glucose/arabinose dehydrogenase
MPPVSTRFLIASALACAGLIAPVAALAQPAQSATPAAQPATPAAQPATPAAPPPWQQGRTPEQSESTLHPFAPQMTGRPASGLPVDKLKVPAGFKVEVWVDGIPEARSLALGDKGTVFVSNRLAKNVYAVVDRGGKREVKTILKGLNAPNGIAFSKGTLYVAERHRIARYDGIEDKLDNPPEGKVVVDGLDPTTQPGHFWKFLALGPDGKLYFNIGSPQNITMPTYMQAVIMRVDPTSGVLENYAQGVRNTVGFDWHPQTKQLWFTEHGRDWISDDLPEDELNVVKHQGEHWRARCSARDAFLHRQDVPGRIQEQYFYGSARLLEPHHETGLRRLSRGTGRQGKGDQIRTVPHGLPHRREGRSTHVGPAGGRAGDEGWIAARLG